MLLHSKSCDARCYHPSVYPTILFSCRYNPFCAWRSFSKSSVDVETLEFFLNVFTEFAEFGDKIFVNTLKGLEPLPTSHLLCERPACYHSASTTHVRDRNFKLNSIHASMIITFPEFAEFSESCAPFRKSSIDPIIFSTHLVAF